jgi:hypothetical protein
MPALVPASPFLEVKQKDEVELALFFISLANGCWQNAGPDKRPLVFEI